jgi:hypothetical protein
MITSKPVPIVTMIFFTFRYFTRSTLAMQLYAAFLEMEEGRVRSFWVEKDQDQPSESEEVLSYLGHQEQ